MNINLITSPTDNDPPPPNHENVIITNIEQIPSNICKSIIINNSLNHMTYQQLELVLSKIRHGGILSIHSTDAIQIAKALYWGKMELSQFSSLVAHTVTQHSLIEIKTVLEQYGYIIDIANINPESFSFTIKAQRS